MKTHDELLAEVQALEGGKLLWEAWKVIGMKEDENGLIITDSRGEYYIMMNYEVEAHDDLTIPFDLNAGLEWLANGATDPVLCPPMRDRAAADVFGLIGWSVSLLIASALPPDKEEPGLEGPIVLWHSREIVRGASPAEAVMRACVLVDRVKKESAQ